jgi:hypothetical protein
MSSHPDDASDIEILTALESSESIAFYMWLLITISAGIIMAQDSWVHLQQPRLNTEDATAAFTKVLVIHTMWLLVTISFMVFTWLIRPTTAWKIHLIVGILTVIRRVGVLVWSFSDAERLQVSTWRCESMPTTDVVTDEFLESCSLADMGATIRVGGDIFLWSADDEHYWRWIVPGEGMATLLTRWPSQVNAMYLATTAPDARLIEGFEMPIPGGNWTAGFRPTELRELRIFFVGATPAGPIEIGTPDAVSHMSIATRQLYHERFTVSER